MIPKVQKNLLNLTVFFALLGSACVKAARRMFVKLTPDLESLLNITLYDAPGILPCASHFRSNFDELRGSDDGEGQVLVHRPVDLGHRFVGGRELINLKQRSAFGCHMLTFSHASLSDLLKFTMDKLLACSIQRHF